MTGFSRKSDWPIRLSSGWRWGGPERHGGGDYHCIGLLVGFCPVSYSDHDFDYERVGVSQLWLQEHGLSGFEAHWQKNSNVAWAFDVWLLNLYPRADPFVGFPKGMTTLNFVPTLATMILGLIAGRLLQSDSSPWSKFRWLVLAGAVGLASGWGLSPDLCPLVKAIWTPSWILFSGGWCFLFLSCSFLLVDWWGYTRLAFPFA